MSDSLNERIRKLRKALDLTQQQFADRIRVKRNTVATYEMGRSEPSDSAISLICREFNVNEEWLRTGEGNIMFLEPKKNDLVAKAAVLLGQKDPVFEAFVETYSKLDPSNREVLLKWGMDFLKSLEKHSEES